MLLFGVAASVVVLLGAVAAAISTGVRRRSVVGNAEVWPDKRVPKAFSQFKLVSVTKSCAWSVQDGSAPAQESDTLLQQASTDSAG